MIRFTALLCLGASLLAGCVASGPNGRELFQDATQPAALPEALQPMFEREPAGARLKVAQSPWGADVTIALDEAYTAASGRVCRAFRVEAPALRPGLACRFTDGNWAEVRVLQHIGRPLLGDAR